MRDQARFRFAIPLFAFLTLAVPAVAQEPTLEDYRDRLPERTVLCVSWQNLSELEALRATNPALRMWASPEMKANWRALEAYQRERARAQKGDAKAQPASARPAGDRARDLAQLITRPGLFALVAPADPSAQTAEAATIYFYQPAGTEDVFLALEAQGDPTKVKHRTYDFEGTTVEEFSSAEGKPVGYMARIGPWLAGGSQKESFEAWLRAVRQAPENSLRSDPAYVQAKELWSPNSQVRGFLNAALLMENLRAVPPAKPGDPAPAEIVEALGLGDWQVLTFDATLDAASLRYQVTGRQGSDASGLLDLLEPPADEFSSLRLAPSNATSYSVARVNLLALWNQLLGVADAIIPPQQAGMVQGILAMAEGLLAMPLDQLMASWGPEYSQFSFPDGQGTLRNVYALGLRDREQVLGALRNVAAQNVPFLPVEEVPGAEASEPIYFRLMSGPSEEGAPPKPSLHFAVAGDWLLVSERKEELDAALARPGGGSPHLGQSPVYQQARNRFPGPLSGFSFLDAERFLETDEAKQLLRSILEGVAGATEPGKKAEAEANPDADAEASSDAADEPARAEEPAIPFPELQIPRGYLKWLLSATARDARSFRFVGIIE